MTNLYTQQARRLASHLKDKADVELKHSACLEAIAAIHGYRDWNTLAAAGAVPYAGPAPILATSRMGECFYVDAEVQRDHDYDVRISTNEIVVSYKDNETGQPWVWKGSNRGDGHFILGIAGPDASLQNWMILHYTDAKDRMLEGSFSDGGYRGMIRIYLDD